MIVDTLLDHSSEAHRILAFYNALKLVGDMNVKSVRGESWSDDQYDNDQGPEDETQDGENGMDDLDEAA
jgi:hypothetical protein